MKLEENILSGHLLKTPFKVLSEFDKSDEHVEILFLTEAWNLLPKILICVSKPL